MEKITYQGWKNCVRLSNKVADLVITTAVGPRVIRFGLVGGPNEFKEYAEMLGRTGDKEWCIYGGHRLWHAPEHPVRTYFPDNGPIEVQEIKGGVRTVQPVEPTTGIQKEMDIKLDGGKAHVSVVHRLRNTGPWAVRLAPWALSVMAQGGKCIIPQPPRGSHPKDLLPCQTLTLWPYTDLSDPRWTFGQKYIMLRQESDAAKAKPQKIGACVPDGWVAYANGGRLFVKKFTCKCKDKCDCGCDCECRVEYPDHGCCFETFTNKDMLEVESLGPVSNIEPGAAVEHREDWFLFKDVPVPQCDADADKYVLPKVKAAK